MSETPYPGKGKGKGKAKAPAEDEDKDQQEGEAGARRDDDQEAEDGEENREQDNTTNEGKSEPTFEDFVDLTPWEECLVRGRLAKPEVSYADIVNRIKNDPQLLQGFNNRRGAAQAKGGITPKQLTNMYKALRDRAQSKMKANKASGYTAQDFDGIVLEAWEKYVMEQSLQGAGTQAIADAINADAELLSGYSNRAHKGQPQISRHAVRRAWQGMCGRADARRKAVSKFSSRDTNEVLSRGSTTTPFAAQEEREAQRQLASQQQLTPAQALSDADVINSSPYFGSLLPWEKMVMQQRQKTKGKETAKILSSSAEFKASYQPTRGQRMKDIDKTSLNERDVSYFVSGIKRKAVEAGVQSQNGPPRPPKRPTYSTPSSEPALTDAADAFQEMYERAAQVHDNPGRNENAYHLLPTAMLADIAKDRGLAVPSRPSPAPRVTLIRELYLQDAIQVGTVPQDPQVLDPLYMDASIDVQLLARRNSLWLQWGGRPGEHQGLVRATDHGPEVGNRLVAALSRFIGTSQKRAWSLLTKRPQTDGSRTHLLQYIDALEGVEWTASERFGSTIWHQLGADELRDAARERGADSDVLRSDTSTIRAWLVENHKSAVSTEELSVADAAVIISELMPDFLRSIRPFFRQVVQPTPPHALAQTRNGHFVASRPVFDRFEQDVEDGIVLDHTSNTGFLCGVRALMDAVHNARWRRFQALNRAWDSIDESLRGAEPVIPTRLDYHDLMHAMFADHDQERADDPTYHAVPNTMGRLTDEFRDFLVRRLEQFGFTRDSREFDEELAQLSTRNNFNATHLQLMVDFMRERRDLEEDVAIGLVVGGTTPESPRAQAYILGPANDDTPIAWIHHDGVQGGDDAAMLGHYSSITQDGGRGAFMIYWGFNLPDQQNLSRRPDTYRFDSPEEVKAKKREGYQRMVDRALASACNGCRGTNTLSTIRACDGQHDQRVCTRCKDLKQTCAFEGFEESDWVNFDQLGMMSLKDVPEQAFRRWDAPLSSEEFDRIMSDAKDCKPTTLDNPTEPYMLAVFCKRLSSHDEGGYNAAHYNNLIARLVIDHQHYDNMLNQPNPNHDPEFVRPTTAGGGYVQFQSYGLVFHRRGVLPVPTTVSNNLADPHLIGFVHEMDQIMAPNNLNPPQELHLVTWGIAGLSTDITAFGSRHPNPLANGQMYDGFIGKMLRTDQINNNTHFRDNTYLVSLVEKRVVLAGYPEALIPGQNAPHFVPHRNKFLLKNNLVDLADRNSAVLHALATNQPVPPDPTNGRLDLQLQALRESKMWRGSQLGGNTVPTDQNVAARNQGRNDHWQ
ncbi:hypothetical protein PRZ48_003760 [Zasmidium cellare]|uniref:Uncharacterized protein n=1 Tax=Zasmidium cellare TaxID=395010 RepID=A0ABR0EX18_ZASCE|nr:hypothetical protein PRZ48_003760 [Zasmidium cellare]